MADREKEKRVKKNKKRAMQRKKAAAKRKLQHSSNKISKHFKAKRVLKNRETVTFSAMGLLIWDTLVLMDVLPSPLSLIFDFYLVLKIALGFLS